MLSASALLTACGGLGLFLLGMSTLKEGLAALAGDALARTLARLTKNPLSGVATGGALTILVQSSNATTVAAVGFVGAGLLSFEQALGIVLGANVGTTLTGWMVALLGFKLELDRLALPLVLAGALLRLFAHGRARAVGSALAGFGLVFVGLGLLREGMSVLQGAFAPQSLPGDGLLGRAALVGIGIALTLITQSSSAGVATALSALAAGAIRWPQAAALVIGMDIGTSAAALLASLGGSAAARRTGFSHVVLNVATGLAAFLLLPAWAWLLTRLGDGFLEREPELALVAFHSGFNLLGVLAVLPFTRSFARWMERLVPERRAPLVRALDASLLVDPPVALRAGSVALAEIASACFAGAARRLREREGPAESLLPLGSEREALLAAHDYLGRLRTDPARPADHERHEALMHALDHLERFAERGRRGTPALEPAPADPLEHELDRLAELLETLAARVDETTLPMAEALARNLARAEEHARLEVLHRAASGDLGPQEASQRLDAHRNLRRLADHAWRIAHHLRAASAPRGASPPAPVDSPRPLPTP